MRIIKTVPVEQIEYDFLKAEWYKDFFNPVREKFNYLIETPDLNDVSQNQLRKQLLWAWREPLLTRLPNDIQWYLAELENGEFPEILIIREIGWETTFGKSKKLKDVSKAISDGTEDKGVDFKIIDNIESKIGIESFNDKLLLISTNEHGPYTIIEGSHRGVAFQSHLLKSGNSKHLPKHVYLGISSLMYTSPWLNFD